MENSIRARNSDFLTSENLHLVPRNENPLKMLFLKKGGKSGGFVKESKPYVDKFYNDLKLSFEDNN